MPRGGVFGCLKKVAGAGPLHRTQTLRHSPPSLTAKLSSVSSHLSLCPDLLASTPGHGGFSSCSESQETSSKGFVFDCNGFVEFAGVCNQAGELYR